MVDFSSLVFGIHYDPELLTCTFGYLTISHMLTMYLNHFPHVNNGLLFVRFMILFLILYDIYIKIYFSWAKLRASSFDITVLACTLGHFCICVHVAIWQRPLLHVVLLYLDFKVWGASIVFFFAFAGKFTAF